MCTPALSNHSGAESRASDRGSPARIPPDPRRAGLRGAAEEIAGLAELVGREMTGALDLSVPLKVDLAAGPNWLDVEPIPDGPAG